MPRPLMDVLQEHHSDSWGWALSVCDWDKPLAEDVLQEAYLRVLDGRAKFRSESSSKTWFFGIIRRVSAEQRRAGMRLPRLTQKWFASNEETAADVTLEAVKDGETAARFRSLLRGLSSRQREVLHLVFYSGLSLEEAAATLDISLGSARTHYHRGKTQLAGKLEVPNE